MKPSRPSGPPSQAVRRPSKSELQRAVASSTAIETGESTESLERRMRLCDPALRRFKLAP